MSRSSATTSHVHRAAHEGRSDEGTTRPAGGASRAAPGDRTNTFHPGGAPTPGEPAGAAAARAATTELLDHPRYRILEWLGAGGMGTVYKAEHRLMGRVVALKVINSNLVDRPLMVERFHREVRAAAQLNHPNIVHAYDADQVGSTHFLVMEYVDGVDLDRVLREHGSLPVAEACSYVRQAALGLQHAFEKGMVHRDIKPHNLMRTPQGRVKILDFGLARYASEALDAPAGADHPAGSDAGLTAAYAGMGTADYVAPEVIRDARHADIRADIYSLGCTLYGFLAGHVPFPGGRTAEKVRAHRRREPRPLSEVRSDVPADLAAVVGQMMAKDPARRYQTPAEVAQALAPFVRAPQHLLVVDDDAVMREALRDLLEREGYSVSTASNGREALDAVRQSRPPSLILLDLVMPVMDGWQFLQELHGDPKLAAIPVVVVSGADRQQARAAVLGAIDYLQKPVALPDLAARLHERCLNLSPGHQG